MKYSLDTDAAFIRLCRERDPATGNLLSYKEINAKYDAAISRATIERFAKKVRASSPADPPAAADDEIETKWTETGATATFESKLKRVATLEELLEQACVDLSIWEVDHHVVNQWEVGTKRKDGSVHVEPLFQVKAWLRRIPGVHALQQIHDDLLASIAEHAPAYPRRVKLLQQSERYLYEISPVDLHVGKLAWGPEVDDEHYDSKIAAELLDLAIDDLLAKAGPFRPERILFPVGNDLLHTDGPHQATTNGTPQDADTRHARMFMRAVELMRHAIDRLELVAPVDVIIVPGNHDRDAMFKLGAVLEAWYRNCDRVTVDNGPTLRKYYRWGKVLLGFTHGSDEKHADLPLIMAHERPQEWAETDHHEWHLGHLHTRRETRFNAGDTFRGVTVRILPSLCGTDAWHYSKGFVRGPRAAEAYLWHFDDGYAGHFSFSFRARNKAA